MEHKLQVTDFAREMFKSSYLLEGETIEELYHRVAHANCLDDYDRAERIKGYFFKSWSMGATPVLSNSGTDRGYPISCFLSLTEDDLGSIAFGVMEDLVLGSGGGGIGRRKIVRGVGEAIGNIGESSGKVPFYKLDDALVNAVSQGGLRRASKAEYLHIDDPEFTEFLKIRKPTGGDTNRKCFNLHHGVILSDEFMNKVVNQEMHQFKSVVDGAVISEVDAYQLFSEILTSRAETGEPYIMFEGNVEKNKIDLYKKADLDIPLSNLCVVPETKILTKNGDVEIQSVVGTKQSVWNGEEWSDGVEIVKTGSNQKVIKVKTNAGDIECTPYHKFYIKCKFNPKTQYEVRASALSVGDELISYKIPVTHIIDGSQITGIVLDEDTTIIDVIDEGRISDTYCFTEPKRNMGIFNGILTGNCSEILMNVTNEKTAVCCLSSVNLDKYDEWKDDPLFIEDMMYFLDGVLLQYEDKLLKSPEWKKPFLNRVLNFVREERAVGLGVMGWHSLLQKKHIPFGSPMAKGLNLQIFKKLQKETDEASIKIAHERGSCLLAARYGVIERFSHKMAIAPTSSISILCGGVSAGIEPWQSNAYIHKNKVKAEVIKNVYFTEIMNKKCKELGADGRWIQAQWKSILANEGSVQHLPWLDDYTKEVYKTAFEIDQRYIIEHASDRGEFIDQGQSVNIFVRHDINKVDLLGLHLMAWKRGLKTLYYCRSTAAKRVNIGGEVQREVINTKPVAYDECLSCQ